MKSKLTKAGIVVFWCVMTGWLVRYEAFPHYFAHTVAGYRGFFADGPMLMDSWMKITFENAHIGYSHTRMDVNETDPAEQYQLQNQTVLNMNIMGEVQHVNVTATAALDVLYRLQRFAFVMSADRYVMKLEGQRVEEETFAVQIRSPAGRQNLRMDIPDDVIFHSPMTEMVLQSMKPGEEISMRTLDPSTLSVADMRIRALRRERLLHRGAETEATVLATEYQGLEVLSWLGPGGEVLRQETPFGWVMEACPPVEAVDYDQQAPPGRDLLSAMAMPAHGVISDPRACRVLEVCLRGLRLEPESLRTDRQEVVSAGESGTVIRITRQDIGDLEQRTESQEALAPSLAPSPFIQSEDAAIVARARRIVAGRQPGLDTALAIHEWVYANVAKDPTVSLPSAVDVLKTMQGDCNEHTYLFVALARAAGLPARVHLGVLYLDGAFYYHAWPAVFVGEWLDMDPTLGQASADATHVYLAEGERSGQMRLLSVIGQVEAEILAERCQRIAPAGEGRGLRVID